MSAVLSVLGLGLLMGMQHATEADHLAAVATLVGRERSIGRGILHGLAWGLGHTTILLCVAGGIGLLGWVISPAWADRFEQIVGAMLIALGLSLLWRLRREHIHFHGHAHAGGAAHFHAHSHGDTPAQAHAADPHRHEHRLPLRTLLVGMVHGLAGSAALALLVSQQMPSPLLGMGYILLFGLGSIAGMGLLSGALAWPMGLMARRLGAVHRVLNLAVALFSVGVGVRLLGSI